MNVHITNIYGFIQDQELKKEQNIYADAAHALFLTFRRSNDKILPGQTEYRLIKSG